MAAAAADRGADAGLVSTVDLPAPHGARVVTDSAFDRVVGHVAAALRIARVPEPAVAEVLSRIDPLRPLIIATTSPTGRLVEAA